MGYRIGGKKGGLEGVVGSVRGKGWRVEEATDHISKFKSAAPRCTYSSSESKASVRRPPPQILVSRSLVYAPPHKLTTSIITTKATKAVSKV